MLTRDWPTAGSWVLVYVVTLYRIVVTQRALLPLRQRNSPVVVRPRGGVVALLERQRRAPRWGGGLLRELDRAPRLEIEHERAPVAHGRAVRAVRAVHHTARAAAVEFRRGAERHDQVDLAVGMPVVRALDVAHLHDVHAEAVRAFAGLDDPAELGPARLAVAHPAGFDRLATGIEDALERRPACRIGGIQFGFELPIERFVLNEFGDGRDDGLKLFGRHRVPFSSCRAIRRRVAREINQAASFTSLRHCDIQSLAHAAAISSGMVPALASCSMISPMRRAPSSARILSKRLPPLQKVSA